MYTSVLSISGGGVGEGVIGKYFANGVELFVADVVHYIYNSCKEDIRKTLPFFYGYGVLLYFALAC